MHCRCAESLPHDDHGGGGHDDYRSYYDDPLTRRRADQLFAVDRSAFKYGFDSFGDSPLVPPL